VTTQQYEFMKYDQRRRAWVLNIKKIVFAN